MRTPDTDERGHVTLDVVDPKEVLASLRSADVATTLRLPVLADAGDDDVTIRGRRDAIDVGPTAPRLPQLERTALDAALEAAARAAKLEELEDLDDDSPTIRGVRPAITLSKLELEGFPDELPTVPAAAMVREALLAATKVALADGEPAPYAFEEDEEDRTLRADRRALAIAMQGDRPAADPADREAGSAAGPADREAGSAAGPADREAGSAADPADREAGSAADPADRDAPPASAPKPRLVPEPVQPPALPVPLVRRVDAWIDELPEAARRVLLDARDAQPSWPLVERTEGAVLRPKQRIPSLRPRT